MSATTAFAPRDLQALASAFDFRGYKFDPFGLVSGYKAYLVYTGLASKSDADLARVGLTREELPRAAMETAQVLRRA